MTTNETQNLSKRSIWLVGGGVGIIISWWIVNFYPEKVATWAITPDGKHVLLLITVALFVASIVSVVIVTTLLAPVFMNRKISIEYKNVKITLDKSSEVEIKPDDNTD